MVFMNYQWVIVDVHRQVGLANPKWASPRCPKFLIYAVRHSSGTVCISQMLHVWNIYLHLGHFGGKCGEIFYTWSIWVWVYRVPQVF